jgi:heme exporter protein D
MDLGPHAAFIWASYAAETIVLAALIGWLLYDGSRQKRQLADLERRGVTRRGSSAAPAKDIP